MLAFRALMSCPLMASWSWPGWTINVARTPILTSFAWTMLAKMETGRHWLTVPISVS